MSLASVKMFADHAMVEPQAGVVRMIDALTLTGRQRKTARHRRSSGAEQRIQNGFLLPGRPDIRGERLAVDGHVNAFGVLVRRDQDARMLGAQPARHGQRANREAS